MDVTQSPPLPLAAKTANGDGEKSRTALTSDYEMFLQMLTTQMTNQDPLNPVDSSDYAVQLATFSSVEQQVLTNDLLTDLTAMLSSSGLSDMANFVGREVRSQAPAFFSGAPIDIVPDIPAGADAARLTIRNAAGDLVQEFDLDPLGSKVTWAGVDEDGNTLASGLYSFDVTSFLNGDVLNQTPAGTYARIIEAQSTPSGLQLLLAGGIAIAPDDVTAMRQGST